MEQTIETVRDEKRGCGWRRPGTYLVSGSVSTGGFAVSDDAADLVLFTDPVRIDPATVLKRGYAYIDGESVINPRTPGPIGAPRLDREMAEAQAYGWKVFGLDVFNRIGHGICAGDDDLDAALATLSAVSWQDREAYLERAAEINDYVESLRRDCGDLFMLPAVIAAKQAFHAAVSDHLYGYGVKGAGAALAACWRLIDSARRLNLVKVVQDATRMILTTNAKADAAYALRYRPPRHAIAPDILDWVGQVHYPSSESFIAESNQMGISRRMPGIPKAVVTPWSRAFLAHGNVDLGDGERGPAIFGYYHIAQMQQVVGADELVPAGWYEARGVQPVQVERTETLVAA